MRRRDLLENWVGGALAGITVIVLGAIWATAWGPLAPVSPLQSPGSSDPIALLPSSTPEGHSGSMEASPALVDLSAQPTVPATMTPEPTPRPVSGAVLYAATMETGFDDWGRTGQWNVVGNMLVSDGSTNGRIGEDYMLAPFQAPEPDYTVEVDIQFIREGSGAGHSFGMVLRDDGYGRYAVGFGKIWNVGNGGDPTVGIWVAMDNEAIEDRPYDLDSEWHTYRAEVVGNQIRLLVDEILMASTTDNRLLSGANVGLWGRNAQINVKAFRVLEP